MRGVRQSESHREGGREREGRNPITEKESEGRVAGSERDREKIRVRRSKKGRRFRNSLSDVQNE